MVTGEIVIRRPNNRLNGILKPLDRTRKFIELHGMDRAGACLLRSNHYDEKGVTGTNSQRTKKSPEEHMDAFDLHSRFFLLRGNPARPPNYFLLKAINKESQGLVPSELSLYNKEELIQINRSKGLGIDERKLIDSTITQESKDKLSTLTKRYDGSKTIYEIGGLCGSDKSRLGKIGLIYLIARTACLEKWDLEIQTCHPRHLGIYLASGLPYRTINDVVENGKITPEPYLDYLGRQAITLYLDGEELRERFPSLEKKLMGKENS